MSAEKVFSADISIRAPARGATIDWVSNPLCNAISIRAPARGATTIPIAEVKVSVISIRAPARGATNSVPHFIHLILFQSALPRGERRISMSGLDMHKNFNPRSREGSDDCPVDQADPVADFNPRSREGSDQL